MRVLSVFIFALACLFTHSLHADTICEVANIEDFDDQEYTWEFTTDVPIISIDSISIEFSHDNVEQVQVFLENTGTGSPYAFYTLINGFGSGVGNAIGAPDGDFTDLDGLSELVFVGSGANNTVRDNITSPVPSGTYLAEDWENTFGTGDPPFDPTTWRLVIRDSSVASNDRGAIGKLSVTFTAVPEPGSASLLLLLGVASLRRRKRA